MKRDSDNNWHHRSLVAGIALQAALAMVFAVACGTDDGGVDPADQPASLDTSSANVDPADIHFDTFDGGSVPLSKADSDLIDHLQDRIPPIDEPVYEGAATGGDWLDSDDLVLGYVSQSGQAYAYPIKILNFHEIVNDKVDGVPVAVTYCPLCRSGVIFNRRLNDETLTLGNPPGLQGRVRTWKSNASRCSYRRGGQR